MELFLRSENDESILLTLVVDNLSGFEQWAREKMLTVYAAYPPAGIIVLEDRLRHFWDTTLLRPDVLFADFGRLSANEELPVPGHNLFTDNIQFVHARQPHLTGDGTTISIKEFRFDSSDVDFKNRVLSSSKSSPFQTTHAGIMASLAAGAGNSDHAGRGVARGSSLLSSNFAGLLPDDDEDYAQFDVSVQNHSYGLDIENYYGAGALAYDVSTVNHPLLLHIFSAGNMGTAASIFGPYADVEGFANLTGNFKMAKNVMVVGAVDSFGVVPAFSSRGPAYDGRIKPDMVAYGQDGASGSAAFVSGSAAIVRQAFRGKYGYRPSSDIVRAVLIGSAKDIGTPGPDFTSGFGKLDLKAAVRLTQDYFVETGMIVEGGEETFTIDLPPNIHRFKTTLVWNDAPALPNAPKSLVNDLNLLVIAPDGSSRQPWALSTFPHPDSLSLPAQRGRDSLNTIEQVSIDFPDAGAYQVRVSGHSIPTGSQSFALAAHWDTLLHFEWTYPVRNDPATAGKQIVLRWETSFSEETGILEWRSPENQNWQRIDSEVALSAGYKKWLAPNAFTEAQVRMRVEGRDFPSDTFLIAPFLRMNIGFNCPDSVLLSWAAVSPEATYRVWGLGDRYLEPMMVVTDTFVVLQKADYPQRRFAVSAISRDGLAEGAVSSAPDIASQGAGCYINNLLAFLNDENQIDLSLEVGSLHGVQKVFIEKWRNQGWAIFREEFPSSLLSFFADNSPVQGANTYRARLEMENGGALTSEPTTVFYAGKSGYLVFPNPVKAGQTLSVLSKVTDEIPQFLLYDVLGKLILERLLDESKVDIPLSALPPGCYFWMAIGESVGRLASGKLLIKQ
jgi:hypothetical protein